MCNHLFTRQAVAILGPRFCVGGSYLTCTLVAEVRGQCRIRCFLWGRIKPMCIFRCYANVCTSLRTHKLPTVFCILSGSFDSLLPGVDYAVPTSALQPPQESYCTPMFCFPFRGGWVRESTRFTGLYLPRMSNHTRGQIVDPEPSSAYAKCGDLFNACV